MTIQQGSLIAKELLSGNSNGNRSVILAADTSKGGVYWRRVDTQGELPHGMAKLFAASPELLAAGDDVISDLVRFCQTQGPGPDTRLQALQLAISKARGQ